MHCCHSVEPWPQGGSRRPPVLPLVCVTCLPFLLRVLHTHTHTHTHTSVPRAQRDSRRLVIPASPKEQMGVFTVCRTLKWQTYCGKPSGHIGRWVTPAPERERAVTVKDLFLANLEVGGMWHSVSCLKTSFGDVAVSVVFSKTFSVRTLRGTWVAQSVERPTSAQVTISRSVSSSPASGSVLTLGAWSLLWSLCLPLCLPLPNSHSVSLSKINNKTFKK